MPGLEEQITGDGKNLPKTVWNWPPTYEWTVKLSIWDGVEPGRIFGGGESGIRTHGTVARTPVFETGAFVHSAISPQAGPGRCSGSSSGNLRHKSGR